MEFLPYKIVKKFIPLADYYGISKCARGLEKCKTSDKGFLEIYSKIKNINELEKIPIKKDKPNGANWLQTRNNRVKAKLGQMKKMNIPLYVDGIPSKMHVILIMWAYSPDPNIENSLKNIKKLLNSKK